MIEWLAAVLILAGMVFFIAGTVGLLRLPDVYCRLHALNKADNIGLGLVVLGLLIQADSLRQVLLLVLIWLLVLCASVVGAYLVANRAHLKGMAPWQR
ncbi:cation:proton antiporter [Candidatus Tenderia electrophaga]|jgi:multicomponent Na+:H+ antiporter subunit G|uniref:Cation:proton antiporter n=1 Tax=Candidatus Tenderia electrophaga TaxID=1748243 RepID=A0A0S2TDD9_9GAMM|nr:cation:proton antiporter [Candidatus Tenderia electrophaga]